MSALRARRSRDDVLEEESPESRRSPRSETDVHEGRAAPSATLAASMHDFAAEQGWDARALTEAAHDAYRVGSRAWTYHGNLGDTYEAVSQIHPNALALLLRFAGFVLVDSGRLAQPNERMPSLLPSLGSALCAMEEAVTGRPPRYFRGAEFGVRHVDGFGWPSGRDDVGALTAESAAWRDGALLVDTMITDAGVPTLARGADMAAFSAHHRYGRGVSVLLRRSSVPAPRLAAEWCTDWGVAMSVMLSIQGPLVTLLHVVLPPPHTQDVEQLSAFIASQLDAATPAVLVVAASTETSEHLGRFGELLLMLGWQCTAHGSQWTGWSRGACTATAPTLFSIALGPCCESGGAPPPF